MYVGKMNKPFVVRALFTPTDATNTISPGYLKRSQRLQQCTHEILESLTIGTTDGNKSTIPTIVDEGDMLEYLDIRIVAPTKQIKIRPPTIASITANKSVRWADPAPSTDGKDVLLWDKIDQPGEPEPLDDKDIVDDNDERGDDPNDCEDCQGGICRRIAPDAFIPTEPQSTTSDALVPSAKKRRRAASRTIRTTHRHDQFGQMYGHLRDGHRGFKARQAMYNSGFFRNMPKPKDLERQCIICWITRMNRIPRGVSVDWAEIRCGVRFHIDFWFANVESIRGNKAGLSIVEGKTTVMIQVPVRSSRASTPYHNRRR